MVVMVVVQVMVRKPTFAVAMPLVLVVPSVESADPVRIRGVTIGLGLVVRIVGIEHLLNVGLG